MKEEEIRPEKIFDEYLRLAKIDVEIFFKGVYSQDIPCPACDGDGKHEFIKSGFSYSCCPNCNTLYVSPRPENRAFERYYTKAASVEYWATTFYRLTSDARREKLWKPKARMIQSVTAQYAKDATIIDIGGVWNFCRRNENVDWCTCNSYRAITIPFRKLSRKGHSCY